MEPPPHQALECDLHQKNMGERVVNNLVGLTELEFINFSVAIPASQKAVSDVEVMFQSDHSACAQHLDVFENIASKGTTNKDTGMNRDA